MKILKPGKGLIEKIQELPESKRRKIFWLVIAFLSLGLLTLYVKNLQKRIKSFEMEKFKEELQLPSLEEKIGDFPSLELPEIETPETEEELKELEKMIEGETLE